MVVLHTFALEIDFWFFFSPVFHVRLISGIMGIIEKIKEIEAEMARTQKNKATGFFLNPSPILLLSFC